jgi:acetyl esterase
MAPQLDPQAQALLDVMRAAGTPQPYTLPVQEARASMRAALTTRGERIELRCVQDVAVSGGEAPLPLRLYRPAEGPLPVALFLHGGGWVLNDLDTHDRLCRRVARRSGWLVASLDYRRAPEHKHPAALKDAQLAYRWLLDNAAQIGADRSGVALVGESSGATTAACLALVLRDTGEPAPLSQILAYPVCGMYRHWPSYEERGVGYTLDLEFVRWALSNYVPAGHDLQDPYLLPLAASDLAGLAPTFVMTAEFDPLRDEGIAFAQRLAAAGVAVEHLHAEDQMHGFLLLDRVVERAGSLIDRLADTLAGRAAPRRTDALPAAG